MLSLGEARETAQRQMAAEEKKKASKVCHFLGLVLWDSSFEFLRTTSDHQKHCSVSCPQGRHEGVRPVLPKHCRYYPRNKHLPHGSGLHDLSVPDVATA